MINFTSQNEQIADELKHVVGYLDCEKINCTSALFNAPGKSDMAVILCSL